MSDDILAKNAFIHWLVNDSSFAEIEVSHKAQQAGGRVFAHKFVDNLHTSQNVFNTYAAANNAAEFGNVIALMPESNLGPSADGLFNGDGFEWELKQSNGSQTSIHHQIGQANKQATHLWLVVEQGEIENVERWARGKLIMQSKHGRALKLQAIYVAIKGKLYKINAPQLIKK